MPTFDSGVNKIVARNCLGLVRRTSKSWLEASRIKSMPTRQLIPIFADQLTIDIATLNAANRDTDVILMVEVMDEARYVGHHKKKIAFLFSAMRHFAEALRADGWTVFYTKLDDPENTHSFSAEVARHIAALKIDKIAVTEAGEWRVRAMVAKWQAQFSIQVDIFPDTRFISTDAEFAEWATGRKQLRMEYFYRDMRRKTGLLMDGDKPVGGKWNYDAENRKRAPRDLFLPSPRQHQPDAITLNVLRLVETHFANHFGDLEPFWFAVTHQAAQRALDYFITAALASFGDYQDAMLRGEKFLYHGVIGLYINTGLLDPLDVCRQVEAAYHSGHAPLNAVEGFIRQIIGWREFVRGIYWLKMPTYREMNFFENTRPLPEFYWTGKTDMACLHATISQTREEAYAHHIQRLMVTGNFALIAGIDPHTVHEWYLAVYADAFEWVELPNTLGMSQFADGGLLGSKPYAASGNYIHKMSDYCTGCKYDVKQKTGAAACPFNPLYWDFLVRNRDTLAGNPRMAQMYRTWDRMSDTRQSDYLESAAKVLEKLDSGHL